VEQAKGGMLGALEETSQVSPENVRSQLGRVLRSATFSQAYRLRNFLQFIVESALLGEYDRIKETSIAVAVFEKSASFDPREEPIVRVEARRLRAKLLVYYESEGALDPVIIHLPKGAYVPFFEARYIPTELALLVGDNLVENSSNYFRPEHPEPGIVTPAFPSGLVRPSHDSRFVPALPLVTVLVFSLATGAAFLARTGQPRVRTKSAHAVPLTTFAGKQFSPAISPDGKQVAFVWNGEQGVNYDIYVKLLNVGTPIRLTSDSANDLHPAWSPDGRYVAFLRVSPTQTAVVVVPALGGAEREITELHLSSMMWSANPTQTSQSPGPIWSRDGQSLIVSDGAGNVAGDALYSVPLDGGPKHQLTVPTGMTHDFYPALSPDGATIAFVRQTSETSSDIFTVSNSGGQLQQRTFDRMDIRGVTWKNNGDTIVFSSNRGGSNYGLWEIPTKGGAPAPISVMAEEATDPFVSPSDDSLAYTDTIETTNIWRQRITGTLPSKERPEPLLSSSRRNSSPRYSPNGRFIAFTSNRSGSWEIWKSDSDGANPQQLTNFAGAMVGSPNWSPDGRTIIFDARPNGRSNIYTVPVTGGTSKAITADNFEDKLPSFSSDGKWIYFGSGRNGSVQLWKMPVQGGPASQITSTVCRDLFESPDDHLIFFESRLPGIWQVPTDGGGETLIPELADVYPSRYMTVTNGAIYFVRSETSPRLIQRYIISTHRIETLATIDHELVSRTRSLTVSPDLKWIVYVQQDHSSSDLMLLKDF